MSDAGGDYRTRFIDADAVRNYDGDLFRPGSYGALLTGVELGWLERFVAELPRRQGLRALDFACGTGRLLAALERLVDVAVGVDVSEEMLAVARSRVPGAQLVQLDLSRESWPGERFDLVTSFRFLLNAQPELRRSALRALRQLLSDDGHLVVNVQGRIPSHKLLTRAAHRAGVIDRPIQVLRDREVDALLRDCGFRVVSTFGYGLGAAAVSQVLPGPLLRAERLLGGSRVAAALGHHKIFVAVPV